MSAVGEKKITVPEFQAATITDEMVQKAKDLIGVWLRRDVHWPAISEPISQIDIRRWAVYSVGDDNPCGVTRTMRRRPSGEKRSPRRPICTPSIRPSLPPGSLEFSGSIGERGGNILSRSR